MTTYRTTFPDGRVHVWSLARLGTTEDIVLKCDRCGTTGHAAMIVDHVDSISTTQAKKGAVTP